MKIHTFGHQELQNIKTTCWNFEDKVNSIQLNCVDIFNLGSTFYLLLKTWALRMHQLFFSNGEKIFDLANSLLLLKLSTIIKNG